MISYTTFHLIKNRINPTQLNTSYNVRYKSGHLQRNFIMSHVSKPLKKEDSTGHYADSIKFIKINLQNSYLTLFPLR